MRRLLARRLVGAPGSDTNGGPDVFLYERSTGTVTLVGHAPGSATTSGDGGADSSEAGVPGISADGAHIVFGSFAGNLVPAQADGNGNTDVFVYERATGTVTLVSHAQGSATATGNSQSRRPAISSDGRYVAFESYASNLAGPGSGDGILIQIFLYDRMTGTVALVSHTAASLTTAGNGFSQYPVISDNGAFVAFQSDSSDLIPGDTNNKYDVFLFEVATGLITLASPASGSVSTMGGFSGSRRPAISGNGAFVAFESDATDLVGAPQLDTNSADDVFLFERATGTVSLAVISREHR